MQGKNWSFILFLERNISSEKSGPIDRSEGLTRSPKESTVLPEKTEAQLMPDASSFCLFAYFIICYFICDALRDLTPFWAV